MVHFEARAALAALACLSSSASLASPTLAPPPTATAPAGAVAQIRSYFDEQARLGRFSGSALVSRNGQILFQGVYGVANFETGEAISLETRFNLASAGKLITRIAILQLAQSGRIDLDEKVGRYLPDYPNPAVRERVALRDLFTMRSGIGSYWNQRYNEQRASLRTIDDYLDLFATDPLQFEPGTRTLYSNGGYIILGKIIEAVSGLSYDAYVARYITGRAGMNDTGHFALDERVPRLAVGYTGQTAHGTAMGTMGGRSSGLGSQTSVAASAAAPARSTHGQIPSGAAGLRPNTDQLPGRGLSAGGGYATILDFLRLERAIRTRRLLDDRSTEILLGRSFATGEGPAMVAGGFPGANSVLTMFPDGTSILVFANRDPPAATEAMQRIAQALGKSVKLPKAGGGG